MTAPLPKLALSVRQPWAWAIIHGGKDIENRSWRRPNPSLGFRGSVCVHAAKGMTRVEYEDAAAFMDRIGVICPLPDALLRGGIIGAVEVLSVVNRSSSRWFMGPVGLFLAEARPVDFIPAAGQLGYFEWRATDGDADTPAKWMTRYGDRAEVAFDERERDLLV